MQQYQDNVFTPSATGFLVFRIATRSLGLFILNYSRPGVMGNRFLKKRLVFFQATNLKPNSSLVPMSDLKKRKPKNSLILKTRDQIVKTREFFEFIEPVVVVITGILTVLLELELFHHIGRIQF